MELVKTPGGHGKSTCSIRFHVDN